MPANVCCSPIPNLPAPSLDARSFYHVERLAQSFPRRVPPAFCSPVISSATADPMSLLPRDPPRERVRRAKLHQRRHPRQECPPSSPPPAFDDDCLAGGRPLGEESSSSVHVSWLPPYQQSFKHLHLHFRVRLTFLCARVQ